MLCLDKIESKRVNSNAILSTVAIICDSGSRVHFSVSRLVCKVFPGCGGVHSAVARVVRAGACTTLECLKRRALCIRLCWRIRRFCAGASAFLLKSI